MRRMLLVLSVAAVMAAMVVAMAMPAFAVVGGGSGEKTCSLDGSVYTCHGGQGGHDKETGATFGSGGHTTFDPTTGEYVDSGGSAYNSDGDNGGGGHRCTQGECVGKGFSGKPQTGE